MTKQQKWRRIYAALTAAALLVSAMPFSAFAAETPADDFTPITFEEFDGGVYNFGVDDSVVTISDENLTEELDGVWFEYLTPSSGDLAAATGSAAAATIDSSFKVYAKTIAAYAVVPKTAFDAIGFASDGKIIQTEAQAKAGTLVDSDGNTLVPLYSTGTTKAKYENDKPSFGDRYYATTAKRDAAVKSAKAVKVAWKQIKANTLDVQGYFDLSAALKDVKTDTYVIFASGVPGEGFDAIKALGTVDKINSADGTKFKWAKTGVKEEGTKTKNNVNWKVGISEIDSASITYKVTKSDGTFSDAQFEWTYANQILNSDKAVLSSMWRDVKVDGSFNVALEDAGQSVWVRRAGTASTAPSAIVTVKVPARSAQPKVTADVVKGVVTIPAKTLYTHNGVYDGYKSDGKIVLSEASLNTAGFLTVSKPATAKFTIPSGKGYTVKVGLDPEQNIPALSKKTTVEIAEPAGEVVVTCDNKPVAVTWVTPSKELSINLADFASKDTITSDAATPIETWFYPTATGFKPVGSLNATLQVKVPVIKNKKATGEFTWKDTKEITPALIKQVDDQLASPAGKIVIRQKGDAQSWPSLGAEFDFKVVRETLINVAKSNAEGNTSVVLSEGTVSYKSYLAVKLSDASIGSDGYAYDYPADTATASWKAVNEKTIVNGISSLKDFVKTTQGALIIFSEKTTSELKQAAITSGAQIKWASGTGNSITIANLKKANDQKKASDFTGLGSEVKVLALYPSKTPTAANVELQGYQATSGWVATYLYSDGTLNGEWKYANSVGDWTSVTANTTFDVPLKTYAQTIWVRVAANGGKTASDYIAVTVSALNAQPKTTVSLAKGTLTVAKNIEISSDGSNYVVSAGNIVVDLVEELYGNRAGSITANKPAIASYTIAKGAYYYTTDATIIAKAGNDGTLTFNGNTYFKAKAKTELAYSTRTLTGAVPTLSIAKVDKGAISSANANPWKFTAPSTEKVFDFQNYNNQNNVDADYFYATTTGFGVVGGGKVQFLKPQYAKNNNNGNKKGVTVVGYVWTETNAIKLSDIVQSDGGGAYAGKLVVRASASKYSLPGSPSVFELTGENAITDAAGSVIYKYLADGLMIADAYDEDGNPIFNEDDSIPEEDIDISVDNETPLAEIDYDTEEPENSDVEEPEQDEEYDPIAAGDVEIDDDSIILALKGDINGNGYIDSLDILAYQIYIQSGGAYALPLDVADVNGDGFINSVDLLLVKRDFAA